MENKITKHRTTFFFKWSIVVVVVRKVTLFISTMFDVGHLFKWPEIRKTDQYKDHIPLSIVRVSNILLKTFELMTQLQGPANTHNIPINGNGYFSECPGMIRNHSKRNGFCKNPICNQNHRYQ